MVRHSPAVMLGVALWPPIVLRPRHDGLGSNADRRAMVDGPPCHLPDAYGATAYGNVACADEAPLETRPHDQVHGLWPVRPGPRCGRRFRPWRAGGAPHYFPVLLIGLILLFPVLSVAHLEGKTSSARFVEPWRVSRAFAATG